MMRHVITLLQRQGINGKAMALADKILPKLTGKVFDSMRATANLTLLGGEVKRQAKMPRQRAVFHGAEVVNIVATYLKKKDPKTAALMWRKRKVEQVGRLAKSTGADPRFTRFFEGFVDRYKRGDLAGAVAWADKHVKPVIAIAVAD